MGSSTRHAHATNALAGAREATKDARNGSATPRRTADAIIFYRVIVTGRKLSSIFNDRAVAPRREAEDRRNIIGGRFLSSGTATNRKSPRITPFIE